MNLIIKKLLRLLKCKFTFGLPERKDLVIFDDEALNDLKYVVEEFDYTVLRVRIENFKELNLNPKILFKTLFNFRGNIVNAYLISLIEEISPKIVLTNINNSWKFSEIARVLKDKFKFFSIQNGSMYDFKRYEHQFKQGIYKKNMNKIFFIPNLFCFGDFEIDDYKKFQIPVNNFYPVGSLRLANFLKEKNINNPEDIKNFEYDIYLVSDGIISQFDKRFAVPGAAKEMGRYIKFIVRYVRENSKKFLCSFKRLNSSKENLELELEFFKKSLDDDDYDYLINNSTINFTKNRHLSYEYMLKSELTIATYSTMLRENLSLGRKTLSINFMDNNIFDFPLNGICKLNNCSYLELKDRIDKILRLSNFEYLKELENKNNYLMNFDKNNSTIDKIKEKINNCLNK